MQGRKRVVFIILAAVICFALAGSFLFIAAGSHHDCTHSDDCEVCRMIDAYIHTMRVITVLAAVICAFTAFVVSTAEIFGKTLPVRCTATLISLKTELRD